MEQQDGQKSQEGPISEGINAINNFAGARRILSGVPGKAAGQIAAQAVKGGFLFLVTNPAFLVVAAIGLVTVLAFIFVFSGAPIGISGTDTFSPSITPAPVEP